MSGALLAIAAGCSGSSSDTSDQRSRADSSPTTPQAKVTVEPADGKDSVAPDKKIAVDVARGSVEKVTVQGERTTSEDGEEETTELTVDGKTVDSGSTWKSSEPLLPGASYTVKATAEDKYGRTTQVTSSFSTLEADKVLHAAVAPLDGETVGVGMPIYVNFSHPVEDKYRDNVERRLTVKMSEPVEGAWHWMSDEIVHFRPKEYWPTGQHVTFKTNLAGVHAGEGLWGDRSRTIEFDVGERHISKVNAAKHKMTVKSGGKVVKTFPISAGSAEYPSSSGTMVAKAKVGDMVMNPPGVPESSPDYYETPTKWNVRITDSGQFVHGAPWSIEAQGQRNVSHGCVNLSLSRAKWFYDFTNRGDVIKVTGTKRKLEQGNGWTDWNVSWDEWVKGSALNRSINGSS